MESDSVKANSEVVNENKCTIPDSNNQNNEEKKVMSKRQQKRLAKRQHWLELKPLIKAKEKEKRKLKIQKAKAEGHSLGPSRKMLKSLKMADSTCKLKICFDLSLADLMTPLEFSKTFKQLHRCYSINRRASAPLQMYILGYTEETKQTLSKISGCLNWDVNYSQQSYCELFDKSDVVYLSSDSPNILEELDHDKVYVIGALVDHNRLKNVCYEKATKEGVGHASFPLDKYFKFKTRKVLTIDQVYSILLCLSEGKSWVEAVMEIVPKRKGVELKDSLSSNTFSQNDSMTDDNDSNDVCLESNAFDLDVCNVNAAVQDLRSQNDSLSDDDSDISIKSNEFNSKDGLDGNKGMQLKEDLNSQNDSLIADDQDSKDVCS